MGKIEIRDAVETDIKAINDIYDYYVDTSVATFEETRPGVEEMLVRMRSIKSSNLPYLVALNGDGRVVGYAYAALYRLRSAYRFTLEDSVYLDKDHLGQGIGSALLERLIVESERLGYRQMIAVIGGSDNHGSIKVHQKHGFHSLHVLKASGLKFGRWVDAVFLQRALGEGDTTIPSN
eukprot:gene413-490_t